MNLLHFITISAAINAGAYQYGNAFYSGKPKIGSVFHHSGCAPSSHKRNRNPRRNKRGTLSQPKARLLARRANPHGW